MNNVPRKARPGSDLELLIIDSDPIRRKAWNDYQKAQEKVAGSQESIERFHRDDIPQYTRWMNSTFGALLNELERLGRELFEKQELVSAVEDTVYFSDMSYVEAYIKVTEEQNQFSGSEPEDKASESSDDDPFEADPWEEARARKDEEFRRFFQDHEDEVYETFGLPNPGKTKADPAVSNRLKEIYRQIVRLLHPDKQQGQMTFTKLELWHEAQAAYRKGDVQALELILTRCEVNETGVSASTSVSILMELTRGLKGCIRTIQAQLRELKRHPAWKFSMNRGSDSFKRKIESQLKKDQSYLLKQIAAMAARLNGWAAQAEVYKRRMAAMPGPARIKSQGGSKARKRSFARHWEFNF